MAENPLVSVLMTAYNREKFIGDAIKSVLDSSYTNFELIIVDDGSIDKTVEIARQFEAKDNRIKVYLNESRLGDYPNRNVAASYATGKYLKYVDSDDYIYPQGLEVMIKAMEQYPEAGWGMCSLKQDPYVNKPFPFILSPHDAYKYNYLGPRRLFEKSPLSAIIKREVFIKAGGFAKLRMVSDVELWHRLGQQYSVVLMMDGLVWYRVHEEREMTDFPSYLGIYERIRINYLIDKNCPLSCVEVKKVLKKRKRGHTHSLVYHLLKLNWFYCRKYISLISMYYLDYQRLDKKMVLERVPLETIS